MEKWFGRTPYQFLCNSYTFQLLELVPKKVPTIFDVMNITERGCDNLHMVANIVPFHDFLVEVTGSHLKRVLCIFHEPLTICQHGVLFSTENSVYQCTREVDNYHSLPNFPEQKHQDKLGNVESATFSRQNRSSTLCGRQIIHVYFIELLSPHMPTIVISEEPSPSRLRN